MSTYRAGRNSTKSWTYSVLLLSVSLSLSGTWTYGLSHWPVYLEIPLLVISAYFLLASVGVALQTARKNAETDTDVRTMLELLPLQAFVSDEAGRLKYANSMFRKYAGALLSKVQDHDLFASVHPDDEYRARKRFRDGIIQRYNFDIQFRQRQPDGSFQHFEARFQYLEEPSANRDRWLGVIVETNDRASSVDHGNGAEPRLREAFDSETAINQLTAILVNSHACLRFLATDPVKISSVVVPLQRILRDAREISLFVKQISPILRLESQGRSTYLDTLFTQVQVQVRS